MIFQKIEWLFLCVPVILLEEDKHTIMRQKKPTKTKKKTNGGAVNWKIEA